MKKLKLTENNEIFNVLNEIEALCQKKNITTIEVHSLYYKVYQTILWLDQNKQNFDNETSI